MTDRRPTPTPIPTELELADALRGHLPSRAQDDVADVIAASIVGVRQQRAWPWAFGAMTDADPLARRRALILTALLLLAVAIAGLAAAGAMRLWDRRDPLRAVEPFPEPTEPAPGPAGAPGPLAFVMDGDLYELQDHRGSVNQVPHGHEPRSSA